MSNPVLFSTESNTTTEKSHELLVFRGTFIHTPITAGCEEATVHSISLANRKFSNDASARPETPPGSLLANIENYFLLK